MPISLKLMLYIMLPYCPCQLYKLLKILSNSEYQRCTPKNIHICSHTSIYSTQHLIMLIKIDSKFIVTTFTIRKDIITIMSLECTYLKLVVTLSLGTANFNLSSSLSLLVKLKKSSSMS